MIKLTWNRNSLSERLNTESMARPPLQVPRQTLEACASTASLLLYTQGPVILCLHHDTLALERRFENHQEEITFISVDNVSERGQGRLVVSYDVGQTAIVWDIFTGIEIARFRSFEKLRVASWMRNGNVVFGIPCLQWKIYANGVLTVLQETRRAMSSSLSPRHQNMFRPVPSRILSRL